MPDYEDALAVHLDRVVEECGTFTLAVDGSAEWTATGTRSRNKKVLKSTGDTAIAAVAALLTLVRGEGTD